MSSPLLHHPRLADCRRLFLRDHEIAIRIGAYVDEKLRAQRVRIGVDLYLPLALTTPRADRLDEVLDYDFIQRTIAERVAEGHVHLQETLCDDLLARLLAHPTVRAARVATAKMDVYPNGAVIGCEVFGIKETP